MLIDTNVLSYIYKSDSRAEAYKPHLVGQPWYASFITVAELYRWPFARDWSDHRRRQLQAFVQSRLVILPFTEKLALTWAELTGRTMRGHPMSLGDSWIAATALHYRLPLVTHNARHFEGVPGLVVITEP